MSKGTRHAQIKRGIVSRERRRAWLREKREIWLRSLSPLKPKNPLIIPIAPVKKIGWWKSWWRKKRSYIKSNIIRI